MLKTCPADAVERRPISSLTPFDRNPRVHGESQIAAIAASMIEWGWTIPILIDEEGGIIAGHGRVLAAQQLGLTEAPCVVARGWTEKQKRAYVLADNKLALQSSWDDELLRDELVSLAEADFDLALTGFARFEIDAALGEALPPVQDETQLWNGMPAFENENQYSFRRLIVHFPDEAAVRAFEALIGQTLSEKTRWIWYPSIETIRHSEFRWRSSEEEVLGESVDG
jgi:hypothetical protein